MIQFFIDTAILFSIKCIRDFNWLTLTSRPRYAVTQQFRVDQRWYPSRIPPIAKHLNDAQFDRAQAVQFANYLTHTPSDLWRWRTCASRVGPRRSTRRWYWEQEDDNIHFNTFICMKFYNIYSTWMALLFTRCPSNRHVISQFTYNEKLGYADATIYSMFRFPDSSEVHLQCDIAVCKGTVIMAQ